MATPRFRTLGFSPGYAGKLLYRSRHARSGVERESDLEDAVNPAKFAGTRRRRNLHPCRKCFLNVFQNVMLISSTQEATKLCEGDSSKHNAQWQDETCPHVVVGHIASAEHVNECTDE